MNFKKIFSIFLRVGISLVLLVLLFKLNKINFYDLISDIKSADKLFLTTAGSIFFITYILCFLRWQMLLKAAGIDIPLKRMITSFCGGVFFSIFLPSTIGGDVVRTADLAAHTGKTKEVFATVFLDRISGFAGLVIVILPAFLFGRELIQDKVVMLSVSIIVVLLTAILLVLFNKFIYLKISGFLNSPGSRKIKETIKDLHYEIHIFRHRKKVIVYNLILSVLGQVISPISIYFIALSLGVKLNIIYFFIFMPIIGAITLLPISIGGLGLRESSFVLYFAKVGVVKQLAVAISLLSFTFILIFGALGGLIYVSTIRHRRLQHNKPSAV